MARGKTSSAGKRAARREEALARLTKKYPGRLLNGTEYTMPWAIRRYPTGILDLDIALNGGLPAGGMTMVRGRPGTGKNYLLCNTIKQAQAKFGQECAVACIGTEMSFDKVQARRTGASVALSPVEIEEYDQEVYNDTGEHITKAMAKELATQIGDFMIVPPDTAETLFDIAVDLVRSNSFHLVAIDSFGSIIPQEEEDKSLEDNARVAGAAGLNSRLMLKLNNAFSPAESGEPNLTALFGINQVRANMNRANPNSPHTSESGGWALKHGRFVTIELAQVAQLKKEIRRKKKKVGKTIEWRIEKQKAGGHEGHTGRYNFMFDRVAHDRERLALELAEAYGIASRSGSWWSYEGERIGQGLDKASKFVAEAGILEDIETEILRAAKVSLF